MALYLETDSLSNQNIASATAIGAYTADADRSILVDVSLDQVAGNGDYVIYITRQISGAGSAYVVLPKTTATAASGETAIAMQSGAITVRSGDVLTVYVDGLAGDTTTVDTTVRWFDAGVVDLVDAPNATAVAAIQSGLSTFNALTDSVAVESVDTIVDANVVRFNYQYLYQAVVSSVTGTAITTTGIKNYAGTALADDSLVALVGWQVFFYKHVAGVPPTDVFWRATIVSYTETVITVDAMPDGFSDTGFTLYILPPGWGSIASDAPTTQEIWEYTTRTLTQSSTSTTDSTAAGSIARRRGDSWSISLTVGAITGYTSLWFTMKHDKDDADDEAILQIKLNSSGSDDDLLYVNGATATDSTKGTITVSDASTGAIVIAVDETVTDDMPAGTFYYDVQALISGTVSTPDSGKFTITADVTRSVA